MLVHDLFEVARFDTKLEVYHIGLVCYQSGCSAEIVSAGDVRITVGDVDAKQTSTDLDPIQLSIFGHRSVIDSCAPALEPVSDQDWIDGMLDHLVVGSCP